MQETSTSRSPAVPRTDPQEPVARRPARSARSLDDRWSCAQWLTSEANGCLATVAADFVPAQYLLSKGTPTRICRGAARSADCWSPRIAGTFRNSRSQFDGKLARNPEHRHTVTMQVHSCSTARVATSIAGAGGRRIWSQDNVEPRGASVWCLNRHGHLRTCSWMRGRASGTTADDRCRVATGEERSPRRELQRGRTTRQRRSFILRHTGYRDTAGDEPRVPLCSQSASGAVATTALV